MLSIGLISFVVAIPLFSYYITPYQFNRITSVIFIYSALLTFNSINIESIVSGVGIYSGQFLVTVFSQSIETIILIVGSFILYSWSTINVKITKYKTIVPTINEYSLIVLISIIGSTLLISCSNFISIYLAIELQSFGVYILATLYKNSESATSAGLKYFLLGGLSSCLIVLGTAIIYNYTGLTQFDNLISFININDNSINNSIILGISLILIGYLFKVSSAPFHNWAPDVYDNVPTIVTSWLITIPKLSIFVFLIQFLTNIQGNTEALSIIFNDSNINIIKNLILIGSVLSLIIGTIIGLSQYKIKRLLAYSTISHVGFILLSLGINSEESIESFVFYLIQYSFTNVNIFIVLLAFGYVLNGSKSNKNDIEYIIDLKNKFYEYPILTISFAFSMFSLAGIPPIIGFFAKQIVLYSSVHNGYYFISFVAIIISVVSASYYLKIVKVLFFETQSTNIESNTNENINENININNNNNKSNNISNIHSFIIAILTLSIILFIIKPSYLLNISQLLALSVFNY